MGEWIEWSGGECPVKGHAGVYVTLRNGSEFLMNRPATCWWEHDGCELDILRYRVVDDEAEREPDTPAKTLRDEFAMAALTGLLAHASGEDPRRCPAMAYVLADAMLTARKESK